jgi:hypothetical protein
VLTANHVVAGLFSTRPQNAPCANAGFYFPIGGWQADSPSVEIKIVKLTNSDCISNEGLDLAACRSQLSVKTLGIEPIPLEFETVPQPDGTPISFTGFPLQEVQPMSSRGTIAARKNPSGDLGSLVLVIDKAAWPGASGSPVYLSNGKVVGILIMRGVGDGSGLGFARPSRYILKFLSMGDTQN